MTQRREGGDSLGVEIRTVQGLECRDECREGASSELVPGKCWCLGPSWGGGERARPGDQGRAREAAAAPRCPGLGLGLGLGQGQGLGHGGGRVLSF